MQLHFLRSLSHFFRRLKCGFPLYIIIFINRYNTVWNINFNRLRWNIRTGLFERPWSKQLPTRSKLAHCFNFNVSVKIDIFVKKPRIWTWSRFKGWKCSVEHLSDNFRHRNVMFRSTGRGFDRYYCKYHLGAYFEFSL